MARAGLVLSSIAGHENTSEPRQRLYETPRETCNTPKGVILPFLAGISSGMLRLSPPSVLQYLTALLYDREIRTSFYSSRSLKRKRPQSSLLLVWSLSGHQSRVLAVTFVFADDSRLKKHLCALRTLLLREVSAQVGSQTLFHVVSHRSMDHTSAYTATFVVDKAATSSRQCTSDSQASMSECSSPDFHQDLPTNSVCRPDTSSTTAVL